MGEDSAPSIEPPPERAVVVLPGLPASSFLEHFDDAGIGERWKAVSPPAVRVEDSELVLDFDRAAGAPCMLLPSEGVDPIRSQLWVATARYVGGADDVPLLSFETARASARVALRRADGGRGLVVRLEDAVNGVRTWSEGLGFGPAEAPALASEIDGAYFTVGLELDAGRERRRLRLLCWSRAPGASGFDQGLRLFLATDWIDWETLFEPAGMPRLAFGDPDGAVRAGKLAIEWIRFADGPRVEAWANGKETAQGAYDTQHWWSYDGDLFVPANTPEPALPRGARGEWDDHYAKDAWVVQDEDGIYYLFHSGKPRGGNYSIGLAFASDVDGPWVKFDGNPLLSPIPGSTEAGLQFPAVVADLENEDLEQRWQMLYDGYTSEPLQHGIFLATAPHPTGPWTRRGRVLGPGEPGTFDELGCAGGIALWWGGQWEVWYPALRPVGDTAVWSIGRAVGPSLAELVRDGHGPRVTQQPHGEGRVSGPIRGRFVPLDDTRGFTRDAVVLLTNDAVKNNYATSRVRRVTPEGLELYYPVVGYGAEPPTLVRQADRASLWPRHLVRAGDEWWLYVNLFGTFRGAGGAFQTFDENTALLKHGGESPSAAAFAFDWLANPPAARGVRNNQRSSENIALVHLPVRR